MRIINNTDVSINPIACAVKPNWLENWSTNASCAKYAVAQNDRVDPGKTRGLPVITSRTRGTPFKVKLTYIRGIGGPTEFAESENRVCADRHPIIVN